MLTEECITLGNPSLRAVYKIKFRAELYLEVAILKWGDVHEEGGLIAWTIHDSASIILLNDEKMFNVLNREAAENASELQHILNMPLSPTNSSSLSDSPLSIQQDESNNLPVVEASDFRLIKSSKGRDKLLHGDFIYNFHRQSNNNNQWSCQIRNCKGRLHTMESTVLSVIGEHIHGPEIGKEEVFEFSQEACTSDP